MNKTTFNKFRKIVYDECGISLRDNKEALVQARVAKRMRALGIDDYRAYLEFLESDKTGTELIQFLDAISTNVTSYFREPDHFQFVDKTFSQWLAEGQRRFRFWSAACSSGEEPYSLAITLQETLNGKAYVDAKILATDISTRVLDACREARYAKDKLKTVPATLKERYFERDIDEEKNVFYTAKSALKNLIVFKRLNLSTPPFPMRGPMDIIFCRNVMIYFDNDVRAKLLADMYRLLKPGGYLLVGHAESLTGMVSDFRVVRPSIYVKS